MSTPTWSAEDPRYTVWKHAHIIIFTGFKTYFAQVQTKHGYYITGTQNLHLDAHDNWPDNWLWTRAPKFPLTPSA